MKLSALTLTLAAAVLTACGTTGSGAPAGVSTPTQAADGTLIGPTGRTLYTYAKDVNNAGTSQCHDDCAKAWPPLGVADTAQPLGDYTIIVRADGTRQWAYKGQPLYYFAKDTKPGEKKGDGLGGNWKVARP